jgi:transcriptional regulator with XRE-family HTH domain
MSNSAENRQHRYAELVGDKLRKLRQERGLSLQEVCDRSGGFVVSTLSAYERGKRSLSLERLLELSDIYGISPPALLDVEGNGDMLGSLGRNVPLRINLGNLSRLSSGERRPLENYVEFLKNLRNDPAREILTMRKDDLDYLATLYGVRPQTLKERFESVGVIEASGS